MRYYAPPELKLLCDAIINVFKVGKEPDHLTPRIEALEKRVDGLEHPPKDWVPIDDEFVKIPLEQWTWWKTIKGYKGYSIEDACIRDYAIEKK